MATVPAKLDEHDVRTIVSKARLQLLFNHDFFAALALGLDPELVDNPQMIESIWGKQPPTMATDGRKMYYAADFVRKTPFKQLTGVIAHEALHMGFGHHTRRGERDPNLFNVACVAPHTMIRLSNGTEKPVTEIQPGDSLMGYGTSIAVALTKNRAQPMLRLTLSSGHVLECTHEHRVLTSRGFIEAGSLRKGDTCFVERAARADRQNQGAGEEQEHQAANRASDWPDLYSGQQHRAVAQDQGANATGAVSLACGDLDADASGVLGRTDRRGGDCDRHPSDGEGAEVSQHLSQHHEHLPADDGMDAETGVLDNLRRQLRWKLVFQGDVGRRIGGAGTEGGFAVLGDEATASGALPELLRSPAEARASLVSHAANGGFDEADSSFEPARLERIEECAVQERYDIVTTGGHYTASGVIVHNCDLIINHICTESGLELPPDAITADKIWPMLKNKHGYKKEELAFLDAESLYDLLEKNATKITCTGWGGVIDARNPDGSKVGKEELEQLQQEAKASLAQAAIQAKNRGKLPGSMQGILDQMLEPKVNWVDRLHRFITHDMPFDYTWRRPNRRYVNEGLYMPSTIKMRIGKIVVFIDTSGSVSDGELQQFLGELSSISSLVQPEKIIVVPIDCQVHEAGIVEYGPGETITSLRTDGRGGTSFVPAFEWLKAKTEIEPTHVIYMTDMEGQFPAEEYPVPTLWVATTKHKAPWGETVHIEVGRGH